MYQTNFDANELERQRCYAGLERHRLLTEAFPPPTPQAIRQRVLTFVGGLLIAVAVIGVLR
jgi:hypothetical protein